jgi:hypothetical protein
MEPPSKPIWIQVLSWLPLGAYILSFGLPAIETGAGNAASGVWAFIMCFLGGFFTFQGHNLNTSFALHLVPFLAWSANPLFWCGMVQAFRGKWRSTAILGAAATACAAAFAVEARFTSYTPPPPVTAPLTEVKPDGTKKVVGPPPPAWEPNTPYGNLLVGYYVWWLSMALLAATGLAGTCGTRADRRHI